MTESAVLNVYEPPLAHTPMNQIVQNNIFPQLDFFFEKLMEGKMETVYEGVQIFKSGDKFFPGKIATALSYLLLNTPQDDPRFARYLSGYRELADMTINEENNTWGIYYYISALNKLKDAGLLERAVSPETLAALKKKLDWRTFVTESDYKLIDLPTNYYGVAFSVAGLRTLLGWDDEKPSLRFLDIIVNHYEKYSGVFGFSDETDGEGRFDRYSVLLIAEICLRCIESRIPVVPQLKEWLRKSVELTFGLSNISGNGVAIGRSIGAYGDTAMLEILAAAAHLKVIDAEETRYAYAIVTRVVAKYIDFWYDKEMRSINMWEHGRRTDAYRGKHRIIGENFTMIHQLVYTTRMWGAMGYDDQVPAADLGAWLTKTQAAFRLTWFAKAEYDRALLVFRDKRHEICLFLVNGGSTLHSFTPYYPLPFAYRMIAGTPDVSYPQLLPRFNLSDGSQLTGLSFIKDIQPEQQGDSYVVKYRQDELNRLGQVAPVKDARIKLETTYTLASGVMTRTDVYTPSSPIEVDSITMEFATFSEDARLDGAHVSFGKGDVYAFDVEGLSIVATEEVGDNPDYHSPSGAMLVRVMCRKDKFVFDRPLTIKWSIKYR